MLLHPTCKFGLDCPEQRQEKLEYFAEEVLAQTMMQVMMINA